MHDAGQGAPPARRRFGAPRNWRDTFIAVLGETSNVSAAARAAAISLSWVYKTRREDAEFARRWFAALSEGYDNLELELLYRLRTGLIEEVGTDGSKRKFDIATGLKILLAHRQTVSREKARDCPEDEAEILAGINAKIDQMRAREKEMAAMLAQDADDLADDCE